jgi:hypothetical protein
MVFAFMMHGGSSRSPETAAAAPGSAPLTATATANASTEDSSSGSPAAAGASAPEASSESPTATASTHAPRPHSTAAQSPAANPAPNTAHASGAPAAGAAGGSTSFNLALASASASVIGANGATAHDVRAALPSSQFTVCYRDAMKRLGRRVEGKMKIHLKMGGDGHVTSALVTAPENLTESMGSCITDSVNQLPVSNVAATGGDADISIVFVPE